MKTSMFRAWGQDRKYKPYVSRRNLVPGQSGRNWDLSLDLGCPQDKSKQAAHVFLVRDHRAIRMPLSTGDLKIPP